MSLSPKKRKKYVEILASCASGVSICMYVSYIPQIQLNYPENYRMPDNVLSLKEQLA